MLDFGFSEIVLTSFIALIVLGPEKLPKVARQVGNWMGRARVMARQLTEQLEREVTAEELLRATEGPKSRREAIAKDEAARTPPQDLAHTPVIAPLTAPSPPPTEVSAPPAEASPPFAEAAAYPAEAVAPSTDASASAAEAVATSVHASASPAEAAATAHPATSVGAAETPATVEPVHGLPASQTTAAAMHASDPPSAAHHDIPTA
jgi:sec-independent protein translocase protein TatB